MFSLCFVILAQIIIGFVKKRFNLFYSDVLRCVVVSWANGRVFCRKSFDVVFYHARRSFFVIVHCSRVCVLFRIDISICLERGG